jgi:8-oxo-dGTP pyrophosphatase MutT (NUDIX family)
MKIATLCFLVKRETEEVLLGLKKTGFGSGKYNGFGGKVEEGEEIMEAALRELKEECGIDAFDVEHLGELTFLFKHKPEWNQVVHVFLSEQWTGEPTESNEMAPDWYSFDKLPFEKMWQDDKHWLPLVLNGKRVKAEFIFGEDNESIIDMKLGEF